MKLSQARRLHNEDEVMIKDTRQVLTVIATEIEKGYNNRHEKVNILCSDGNWYKHSEVM